MTSDAIKFLDSKILRNHPSSTKFYFLGYKFQEILLQKNFKFAYIVTDLVCNIISGYQWCRLTSQLPPKSTIPDLESFHLVPSDFGVSLTSMWRCFISSTVWLNWIWDSFVVAQNTNTAKWSEIYILYNSVCCIHFKPLQIQLNYWNWSLSHVTKGYWWKVWTMTITKYGSSGPKFGFLPVNGKFSLQWVRHYAFEANHHQNVLFNNHNQWNLDHVTASKTRWWKQNFVRCVTVMEGCRFDLNSTVSALSDFSSYFFSS